MPASVSRRNLIKGAAAATAAAIQKFRAFWQKMCYNLKKKADIGAAMNRGV